MKNKKLLSMASLTLPYLEGRLEFEVAKHCIENSNDAQRLSIVTPDYMHQVDTFDNILVTNGAFNSMYDYKNNFFRNVSPMTEIGVSVALLGVSQKKIKSNLDSRQIALTKATVQAIRSWYESKILAGLTSSSGRDKEGVAPSPIYFLNMAPTTLAAFKVTSGTIAMIEKVYSEAFGNANMAEVFSSDITSDFIKSYSKGDPSFSSRPMTSVDFFETFSLYLESSKYFDAIRKIVLDVYQLKVNEILESLEKTKAKGGDVAKDDEVFVQDSIAKDFFSNASIIMFIDLTLRSAIANDNELFGKISDSLGITRITMSSVMTPDQWLNHVYSFITSLGDPNIAWSRVTLLDKEDQKVLTNAYNRILGADAAAAITSLNASVEGIRSFSSAISSFYSGQGSYLDKSYDTTPDLIRAHKNMMRNLTVAQDVASARNAVDAFLKPDGVFNKSVAGLLYGICIRDEDIEKELVSDMMNMAVNTDVIRSFMSSDFADGIVLKTDAMGRFDDYGTGISGYTLVGNLDAATNVVFTPDDSMIINDVQMHELQKMFSQPASISANQAEFRKLALIALGSTNVHSAINGSVELATFATEFAYSKAVRDELLPQVRRINNAVGLQIHMYRVASTQWIRHYLHGLNDFCNFVINRLEAEKKQLQPRIYSDVTVTNLQKLQEHLSGHLLNMFGDKTSPVPSMVVPVVNFFKGSGSRFKKNRIDNIDDVLDVVITNFRKANERPMRMMEEINVAVRAFNLLSKEGEAYKLTDNPMYFRESLFKGFSSIIKPSEAAYTEVGFDRYANVRPTAADIEKYRSASFRNDQGLHFMQGGLLDQMLAMIVSDKDGDADPEGIVSSRFGLNNARSFVLNPFLMKKARLRAKDALQRVFTASRYSDIRRNRAHFMLNYACQSMLRVSCSPYEGMEHGFSPAAETFLSTSDEMTLQKMLGLLGLSADANIMSSDTIFLTMVDKIQRAKGPFVLTDRGRSILEGGSKDKEPKAYATRALIGLSNNYKLGSAQTATYTMYLRTPEMLDALYADYLVEDISHNYDISPVEDALIRNLKSSGFDDIILALSSEISLPLQSVETDADIISGLEAAGTHISKVFFPVHAFPGSKADDPIPAPEGEDPNPAEE